MKISISKILNVSLPIYLFLLPWQARYIFAEYSVNMPVFSGISFYATDALFVVIIFAFAFWWRKNGVIFVWRKASFLAAALVVAYSGLSLLWTPHIEAGLYQYIRVLQTFMLFFIVWQYPIRREVVFLSLLSAGAVQGWMALHQFLLQVIQPSTWLGMSGQSPADLGVSIFQFAEGRWLRAYGMLPHPNILGGFLAVTSILSARWYIEAQAYIKEGTLSQKKHLVVLVGATVAFLFNILGLFLSFSRSALAAFVIAFIIFCVGYAKHNKMALVKLSVLVLVLFACLNLVFGGLWLSRYVAPSQTERSYEERVTQLDEWKTVTNKHWLVGVGVGGYLPTLVQAFPGRESYEYQPAHNVWLLWINEFGLLGLTIICVISLISFRAAAVRWRWSNSVFFLAVSLLVVIGITSLFDHYWWTMPFGLMLSAILIATLFKKNEGQASV